MNRISIAAVLLAAAMSPAFAADLVVDVPEVAAAPASSLAGYVELTVDSDAWSDEFGFPGYPYGTEEGTELNLTGAARVAIPVAPQMVLQLDAWVRGYSGSGSCDGDCDLSEWDYSGTRAGLAAHFAYLLDNGSVGAFLSVGSRGISNPFEDDTSGWVTGGVEAVMNMDNFRVYGQVGASKAISGYDGDNEEVSVFAQGVLAYYIDPNLRVSANAGIATWSGTQWGSEETDVNWGARIEKKFEGMPFSVFVGYQGWAWDGGNDDTWEWSGTQHAILVGARFAFGEGTDTLQDLDNTVGLRDMNLQYGDLSN